MFKDSSFIYCKYNRNYKCQRENKVFLHIRKIIRKIKLNLK